MSLYGVFETDLDMEASGVWIDYGDFRIRIASAGQGNKNYVRYAEKKLKPVRRAIEAGAMSNDRSQGIMADIYAKTVVLDWETDGKKGIEARNGKLLPFSIENVEKTLINLPRLFMDLQEQAGSLGNFRKEEQEEEVKNSPSS